MSLLTDYPGTSNLIKSLQLAEKHVEELTLRLEQRDARIKELEAKKNRLQEMYNELLSMNS